LRSSMETSYCIEKLAGNARDTCTFWGLIQERRSNAHCESELTHKRSSAAPSRFLTG
jgi:hypothetical protein